MMSKVFKPVVSVKPDHSAQMALFEDQETAVFTDPKKIFEALTDAKNLAMHGRSSNDVPRELGVAALPVSRCDDLGSAVLCASGYLEDSGKGVVTADIFGKKEAIAFHETLSNVASLLKGESCSGISDSSRSLAEEVSRKIKKDFGGEISRVIVVYVHGVEQPVVLEVPPKRGPMLADEAVIIDGVCISPPGKNKKQSEIETSSGDKIKLTEVCSLDDLVVSYLITGEMTIHGRPYLDENGEFSKIRPDKIVIPAPFEKYFNDIKSAIDAARNAVFLMNNSEE